MHHYLYFVSVMFADHSATYDMLRNGRTGHTWHLGVDHIMLVMKMRSSSPVNRLVGLYRGFMCMYKKQKKKTKKRQKKKSG